MQRLITEQSTFKSFLPPTDFRKVSQAAIEALLQKKIGLDAKTIGSRTIAKSINRRMSNCSLSDLATYFKLLQTSKKELDALIEDIVIPETWFFRDRKPFDFLSYYVKTEWSPTHKEHPLRILSVPCSTGEEPYSIAITLLEAGLTSKNFCIDAVDISQKSIVLAQQGVYNQNSFRGCTAAFQKQYFTQIDNGYHLNQAIINNVNFICANLLDSQSLKTKKPYHVIFCRNLLIYLEQSARKQVIQVLNQLLNTNGLLFIGYSETGQILQPDFVPVRYPSAFAFRKDNHQFSDVQPKSYLKNINLPKMAIQSPLTKNVLKKSQKLTSNHTQNHEKIKDSHSTITNPVNSYEKLLVNKIKISSNNSESLLEIARNFADQGQLKEAATLCKAHLSENPTNAETYFLLAQVYQAEGNEQQAEQYFQKAIYLAPKHYEALMQLALLKEYHGDQKGAAILRQRIQRL